MVIRIALAGDTMLGRKVAERFPATAADLWSAEVRAAVAEADLCVLNLECCISERGRRWPDPAKPFFFRAPPHAAEALAELGVDAVTLANNHALDFGIDALEDTFEHLNAAGIAWTGAGSDLAQARRPAVLDTRGVRVAVLGVADHPADYAASEERPGIAYADLGDGLPEWVRDHAHDLDADLAMVTPHWGPNMVAAPVQSVRAAAPALLGAGVQLVAGHSAHVFHGVEVASDGTVLYDLGDFIDDYAVDARLRNDLGLLWLVDVDDSRRISGIEALPLRLDYCYTRAAEPDDVEWIRQRLRHACAEFGTAVTQRGDRLAFRTQS